MKQSIVEHLKERTVEFLNLQPINETHMKIAIIGTGNVRGALATRWSHCGHEILLGVRDPESFKGRQLPDNPGTSLHSVQEAVKMADVILLATPAKMAIEVTKSLGDTSGKILIDTMNIVRGNGLDGYRNTTQAILDHTETRDAVKCFNTTGANNMADPMYGEVPLDMFVAGESVRGVEIATQLSKDAGFENCIKVGGNDHFEMLEQLAWFWINLAMFQGMGREFGIKILKRSL